MRKILLGLVMNIAAIAYVVLAVIAIDGGKTWAYIALGGLLVLSIPFVWWLNHTTKGAGW